jgi:hypothetical protein
MTKNNFFEKALGRKDSCPARVQANRSNPFDIGKVGGKKEVNRTLPRRLSNGMRGE